MFKNVAAVDSSLDPTHVYSQVPAFSASDRAMIDVLTCTRDARLAVLELKADEDIHLPLQGPGLLGSRSLAPRRGEFQQYGYFPGMQLSPRPPLLMLIAPSLRVHPAMDTVLRYFSPAIEWALVGVDERWREGMRVIYRKSSAKAIAHGVIQQLKRISSYELPLFSGPSICGITRCRFCRLASVFSAIDPCSAAQSCAAAVRRYHWQRISLPLCGCDSTSA